MRLLQVDAFTAEPFKGNPAAICLLDRERDAGWMQNVAMEMNLAETAFLQKREDGDWSLRWFTPAVEVDLCGHATLGSAHALWSERLHDGDIRFHTRSGMLTAHGDGQWIVLDFPATREQHVKPPAELLRALRVTNPVYAGKNKWDYIVEVESEEVLRGLQPDMAALKAMGGRGVIVTSRPSNGHYDFVSRFFAPAAGIDEDPATGSAHCCLTPYWAERLGKTEFVAYQASPRGATFRLRLDGDRVKLKGRAVSVLRGELLV